MAMVINGQWQWSSMVINGNINGLSYENSAHYKKANNIAYGRINFARQEPILC